MQTEILIEKIKHLSPPRQAEVAEFVEFLTQKRRTKTRAIGDETFGKFF